MMIWLRCDLGVSQTQGRIQDFQIEGAQKILCTQRTSQAQNAKSLISIQGPLGF